MISSGRSLQDASTPERHPRPVPSASWRKRPACRADVLARLTTIYTTPGFTDEKIHIFLATGLKQGKHRREKDEFMEVHTKRWSEIMTMTRTGEIKDAKTLVGVMYVECFRRKASY